MTLEQLLYLCTVFGWSSLGFLAGLMFADARRDLGRIASVVATRKENAVLPEEPRGLEGEPPRAAKRRRVVRIVAAVLIVLAVASSFVLEYRIRAVLESMKQQVDINAANDATDRAIQRCLSTYADGFARALEARSGASAAASEALDEWMTILNDLMTNAAPGQQDPAAARERLAKFRAATADYLAKREKSKQEQREHPYPPSPREC